MSTNQRLEENVSELEEWMMDDVDDAFLDQEEENDTRDTPYHKKTGLVLLLNPYQLFLQHQLFKQSSA